MVTEPLVTAFSIIYQMLMHDMPNYEVMVCYAEYKASEYVGIPVDKINELLNQITINE